MSLKPKNLQDFSLWLVQALGLGLSLMLVSCFQVTSSPGCQTTRTPTVSTLSWKLIWDYGSVDISQRGDFFFSPRIKGTDISSKIQRDEIFKVNIAGEVTNIRTGPEFKSYIPSEAAPENPIVPVYNSGQVAAVQDRLWISDRLNGQIRILEPYQLFYPETLFENITDFSESSYSAEGLLRTNGLSDVYGQSGCSIFQINQKPQNLRVSHSMKKVWARTGKAPLFKCIV